MRFGRVLIVSSGLLCVSVVVVVAVFAVVVVAVIVASVAGPCGPWQRLAASHRLVLQFMNGGDSPIARVRMPACECRYDSKQPACYWDPTLETPCLFFAPDASNNYSMRNMVALIAVLMAIEPFVLFLECASISLFHHAKMVVSALFRTGWRVNRWGGVPLRRDISQRVQRADIAPPLGAPAGSRP